MTAEDFWSRHVFVLLSSDIVHRGRHGDLVQRLRDEGFPPVAARALQADPELIDDLYSDLIAGQWQTWRYRLVDAVLGLGPTIALICRCDGRHAELAKLKGYQHPTDAELGTLRRDFDAINSAMSVMHSSDGPEDSEREAAVFGLTPEHAGDPEQVAAEIDQLCRLNTPGNPETRDFEQVLAAVRTRLVGALWEELPAAVRRQITAEFADTSQLGLPGAGDRLATVLGGRLPAGLEDVVRCDFTPKWRDELRMAWAEERLRRAGVVLDEWERVVLGSSLHFPPLRASVEAAR